MSRLMAILAVLQIGVPLALLGWQVSGRDTNVISWCLKHGAVWSYIYATSLAGLWLLVPWYIPHVLLVISISLAARTLPGAFRVWRSPQNGHQWFAFGARAALAVLCVGALWFALQGRKAPSETAVDLAFPLRSGHYYIANGGSTELVNAHVRMLSSNRFRRYRGSSYGVDIVALNVLGSRAEGMSPHDSDRYAIFGHAI